MSSTPSAHLAGPAIVVPDAHGHAAILLVESLLHVLIARDVITLADAIEIVDTAAEVSVDIASDPDSTHPDVRRSIGLLQSIGASLSGDLPR